MLRWWEWWWQSGSGPALVMRVVAAVDEKALLADANLAVAAIAEATIFSELRVNDVNEEVKIKMAIVNVIPVTPSSSSAAAAIRLTSLERPSFFPAFRPLARLRPQPRGHAQLLPFRVVDSSQPN